MTESVPLWLWRSVTWGLGVVLAGVAALAVALALGWADPARAGPLVWEDDFKGAVSGWEFLSAPGAALEPRDGALVAEFTVPGQQVFALTQAPASARVTLEAAAAQTAGEPGAAYGLVFGWQDQAHYQAVLVNGNGYAEAFQQSGSARRDWFPFGQWPHLLYGAQANRVRVDVSGSRVRVRINDEWLCEFEAEIAGRIGVTARSVGSGQVVFSWVRLWADK